MGKTHDLRETINLSLIALLFSLVVYFIGYRNSRRSHKNKELVDALLVNDCQMGSL